MSRRRALIEFGSRVKKIRKLSSMTQLELAEEVGVSASHIGMIERGDRNPSLVLVKKIAKALNIQLSHLLASWD